ncbi:MAG: DUF1002 domain-containing protein [Clostridiales bacterium]|nr:DUF1002 domain-containing protein [Clostridiales bacterium]
MKRLTAFFLAVCMVFSVSALALADGTGTETKGYLVLGEDLTSQELETVLSYLQVEDMDDYVVSYTTNEQEHEAFDSYLSASVVGSRALSSILLIPGEEGDGISVTSYNITYCTVEMYQNALISAGVEDVDIYIAAPSAVSGTCALLSAMNAYSTLTGEEISEASADAAVDELVTTGELGDAIGSNDTAAELIALLKQQMLEQDLSEDELSDAIDNACEEMGVTIEDELKQKIIDLLMKLKETDIDVDALAQQAGQLYDKISDTMDSLGITRESALNFFQKALQFVQNLLSSLFGSGE